MDVDGSQGGAPNNGLPVSEELAELSDRNTRDLEALDESRKASQPTDGLAFANDVSTTEKVPGDSAQDPPDPSGASQEPKTQGPSGGFDTTPVPHAPPGYRVKITFHRASALPIADLVTLSSDPYFEAELVTSLQTRHKEDPILRFRGRTLWNTTEPLWDEEWILDHVPASGFRLKVRIYDEDTGDHDDRLGNVHVDIPGVDEQWPGIKDQPYKIKKRMGSKRAYFLRAIAVCMHQASEMSGHLYVSVEVLGKSPGDEGGRTYTVGPNYWCKHYSPLLGRLVGSKADPHDEDDQERGYEEDNQNGRTPVQPTESAPLKPSKPIPLAAVVSKQKKPTRGKHTSHYNFQANQIQLTGPVPQKLYHRFVEFRPFIKALFTASGVRGIIFQKALHHQHAQVYNYNRDTKYGVFREGPCNAMTEKFLDLCHHAEGGRVFTYVITLDALMRFTETGKEFGIDLLSKHSMHSDVDAYIAYSGEFFVRQIQKSHRHRPSAGSQTTACRSDTGNTPEHDSSPEVSGLDASKRPEPRRLTSSGSPRDPSNYELIIDNESGTYRPSGALLPLLHEFLSKNFPGLKIVTLNGLSDGELLKRLKLEQREQKRAQGGDRVLYTQVSLSSSGSSSINSSAEEDLDRRVEQHMLEERRRADEGVGSSHSGDEHEHKKKPGEPKHKLAEAVLPFVENQKVRNALLVPGGSDDQAATRVKDGTT